MRKPSSRNRCNRKKRASDGWNWSVAPSRRSTPVKIGTLLVVLAGLIIGAIVLRGGINIYINQIHIRR